MKPLNMLLMAVFSIMTTTVFSQEKAGIKDTTQHVALYTCPMHPNVKMDKAGKCPTCGMELVLSTKEKMKRDVTKTYTCPVHADVISNSPGKCSKCDNNLLLSPKEKMKMEVVKKYTCSMHPDVSSHKPGKCPKCNMDLVKERKNEHAGHGH